MQSDPPPQLEPKEDAHAFYRRMLTTLNASGVPYLVGGAYALKHYSGISRDTKDLDIFVREADVERVLALLGQAGCETEITFPHWLGKAYCGNEFIDVIFKSGNGVSIVDDAWFENATPTEVLDIPVQLCSVEDLVFTKAFIMERERYDGGDMAHLLRSCAETLNWRRLLLMFGPHWRVLLSHLVLFGFIYPQERTRLPPKVMRVLLARLSGELVTPGADEKLCQGTLLSRAQYLIDLDEWGYHDARIEPRGNMTPEETALWTAAIDEED